jgi:hypothetical protein
MALEVGVERIVDVSVKHDITDLLLSCGKELVARSDFEGIEVMCRSAGLTETVVETLVGVVLEAATAAGAKKSEKRWAKVLRSLHDRYAIVPTLVKLYRKKHATVITAALGGEEFST